MRLFKIILSIFIISSLITTTPYYNSNLYAEDIVVGGGEREDTFVYKVWLGATTRLDYDALLLGSTIIGTYAFYLYFYNIAITKELKFEIGELDEFMSKLDGIYRDTASSIASEFDRFEINTEEAAEQIFAKLEEEGIVLDAEIKRKVKAPLTKANSSVGDIKDLSAAKIRQAATQIELIQTKNIQNIQRLIDNLPKEITSAAISKSKLTVKQIRTLSTPTTLPEGVKQLIEKTINESTVTKRELDQKFQGKEMPKGLKDLIRKTKGEDVSLGEIRKLELSEEERALVIQLEDSVTIEIEGELTAELEFGEISQNFNKAVQGFIEQRRGPALSTVTIEELREIRLKYSSSIEEKTFIDTGKAIITEEDLKSVYKDGIPSDLQQKLKDGVIRWNDDIDQKYRTELESKARFYIADLREMSELKGTDVLGALENLVQEKMIANMRVTVGDLRSLGLTETVLFDVLSEYRFTSEEIYPLFEKKGLSVPTQLVEKFGRVETITFKEFREISADIASADIASADIASADIASADIAPADKDFLILVDKLEIKRGFINEQLFSTGKNSLTRVLREHEGEAITFKGGTITISVRDLHKRLGTIEVGGQNVAEGVDNAIIIEKGKEVMAGVNFDTKIKLTYEYVEEAYREANEPIPEELQEAFRRLDNGGSRSLSLKEIREKAPEIYESLEIPTESIWKDILKFIPEEEEKFRENWINSTNKESQGWALESITVEEMRSDRGKAFFSERGLGEEVLQQYILRKTAEKTFTFDQVMEAAKKGDVSLENLLKSTLEEKFPGKKAFSLRELRELRGIQGLENLENVVCTTLENQVKIGISEVIADGRRIQGVATASQIEDLMVHRQRMVRDLEERTSGKFWKKGRGRGARIGGGIGIFAGMAVAILAPMVIHWLLDAAIKEADRNVREAQNKHVRESNQNIRYVQVAVEKKKLEGILATIFCQNVEALVVRVLMKADVEVGQFMTILHGELQEIIKNNTAMLADKGDDAIEKFIRKVLISFLKTSYMQERLNYQCYQEETTGIKHIIKAYVEEFVDYVMEDEVVKDIMKKIMETKKMNQETISSLLVEKV